MASFIVHTDDCDISQVDASFNCTCGAKPEPLPDDCVSCGTPLLTGAWGFTDCPACNPARDR